MAGELCFVEWRELFVSREKANRVVHYFLKNASGESVLAVVGTERSVRHMFYVVADEFLAAYGEESSVHAGFRWRSRREVVNWLTSMLSKQHRQSEYARSPRQDPDYTVDVQHTQMREPKGRIARNVGGQSSDIVWSGVYWPCGKQLKHYPAFGRGGTTIVVHSFVYVMAEMENRYLAYLEDMYEDRKGQKKVKVRWFHHNREVQSTVSLRNPHPMEVFITPYAQVISAECVDGPAIVLSREHYEKCIDLFPDDIKARSHFCFRQYKNQRVQPFKLSKLRGYFDQQIFSCFNPDFFEDNDISSEDEVKAGGKRARSGRENLPPPKKYSPEKLKYTLLPHGMEINKHAEVHYIQPPVFNVNDKIEILSQDSGIRGCWFRCTVVQVSKKAIKVRYDDLEEEDNPGYHLEEWVPAFRLAIPDKFGMRYPERPLIRPAVASDQEDALVKVGSPVDAWWSDGWWEGVVTGDNKDNDDNVTFQIYVPGENMFLNVKKHELRISREWLGDQWVEVEGNADILSVLSAILSLDCKVSAATNKCDGSTVSGTRVSGLNEIQGAVSPATDPQQQMISAIADSDPELPSGTTVLASGITDLQPELPSTDLQQELASATTDPQDLASTIVGSQSEIPSATTDMQHASTDHQELASPAALSQPKLLSDSTDPQQENELESTEKSEDQLAIVETLGQLEKSLEIDRQPEGVGSLEKSLETVEQKCDESLEIDRQPEAVESLENPGKKLEAAEAVESLENPGKKLEAAEAVESLENPGKKLEAAEAVEILENPEKRLEAAEAVEILENPEKRLEAAEAAEILENPEKRLEAAEAAESEILENPGKRLEAVEAAESLGNPGKRLEAAESAESVENPGKRLEAAEAAESLENPGKGLEAEAEALEVAA